MKINELIAESQTVEEGIGSFLGKAAGNVAGGLGAAWKDAKQGYKTAKDTWDPKDPPGTYSAPTKGAAPAGGPDPAELRQQAAALTQQADQLEKTTAQPDAPGYDPQTGVANPSMMSQNRAAGKEAAPYGFDPQTGKPNPAPATEPTAPATDTATAGPAGTTYDAEKAAADKLAKGQADQQLAQQQMKATADANAAKSAEDAAIKAAADAAKAKPPFQQTASDKLAIKAAADKGIREAKEKKKKLKKKKMVAEFQSNFLGRKI